jgi:DNA polymerase/3'-5' exonuclease PolX
MSDKVKIFLTDARRFAEEICKILEPACERIEIAGSIRRMSATVGDIEIVCQPKLTIDGPESLSAIDTLIDQLVPGDQKGTLNFEQGPDSGLRWNSKRKANGSRYKRLIWVGRSDPVERIPVDLFCVLPPASWGAQLAIRTGPWEFSKGIVTKRSQGGAMPEHLEQRHGTLWNYSGVVVSGEDRWKAQPLNLRCPDEETYFAALGLPCWPPEERTAQRLEEYLLGTLPNASD